MEFKKLCRTCLSASKNMKSLYETCATSTKISCAEMLSTITPIICLGTDGLPTQICNKCNWELNRLNAFRLKCLESDATLRSYLDNDVKTEESNIVEEVLATCESPVILTNNKGILEENSNKENNNLQYSDITIEQNVELRNHLENKSEELLIQNKLPGRLDNSTIFEFANIMTNHSQDQQSNTTAKSLKDPLTIGQIQEIDQEIDLIKHEVDDVKFEKEEDMNIEAINAPVYQQENEKSYLCSVCNKSYRHKGDLKVHKQIMHTGVKPYSCTVCDKSFNTNEHLTSHMGSHTRKKSYSCAFCNNSFASKDSLNTHLRTHSSESPYLCSVCNISFETKRNITFHMQMHTGNEPYTCTVCNMSFRNQQTLQQHMILHTIKRTYTCTVCNTSSKNHLTLQQHMMLHTSFLNQQTLQQQVQTHTVKKSYTCTTCDISFEFKQTLKQHMRTHTGEKPYTCTVCDRSFITNFHLAYHMHRHT